MCNVAAGSITGAIAGSWFKWTDRGFQTTTTANVTVGNIG
jgi:hypothetical protein